MTEWAENEQQKKAYHTAIKYLARRPHSEKELNHKLLEKGYEQCDIDKVLQKLNQLRYVNDQQFAEWLAEYRLLSQKRGRQWVKYELNQKGISQEDIEQALDQIDEESEFAQAMELATKRWLRQKGDVHAKKQRIGGFLYRRGFSSELIQRVLRELRDEESEL